MQYALYKFYLKNCRKYGKIALLFWNLKYRPSAIQDGILSLMNIKLTLYVSFHFNFQGSHERSD